MISQLTLAFSSLKGSKSLKKLGYVFFLFCLLPIGEAGSYWGKPSSKPEMVSQHQKTSTVFKKSAVMTAEVNFWKAERRKTPSLKMVTGKPLWRAYHQYNGYDGEPDLEEFNGFVIDHYNDLQQQLPSASENFIMCETILSARLFFNTYGKPSKPVMSYGWEPEVSSESLLFIKDKAWKLFHSANHHAWNAGDFSAAIAYLKKSSQCLVNPKLKCEPEDVEYAVQFIPTTEEIFHQALKQGLPQTPAFCYALPHAIQSKQLYHHQLHQNPPPNPG